jgi:hypothetical protein
MTLKELKQFIKDIPEKYDSLETGTMNSESYTNKMEINGYFIDTKENRFFFTNLFVVPRT